MGFSLSDKQNLAGAGNTVFRKYISEQNKINAQKKQARYQAEVAAYNATLQVNALQDQSQDAVSTALQNEQTIQLNHMRAEASNIVTATSTGASGASQDRVMTSFDASAANAAKANEDKLTRKLNAAKDKQSNLLTNAVYEVQNADRFIEDADLFGILLDTGQDLFSKMQLG